MELIKRSFVVVFVLALALSFTSVSFADNAFTKAKRGFANTLTGWMELPYEVKEETEEENWLAGMTLGLCKGTVNAVGRTLAGVYELATFPLPSTIGEPKDYQPVIDPAYVWDKFESHQTASAQK